MTQLPPEASSATLAGRLAAIRQQIAEAAATAQRKAAAVTLIAVAKTFPAEAVIEALAAGQRHFGENRVQEGMAKYPALREIHPDLVLHLIGPLQTNKVKQAVAYFDVIHTLDRESLAEELAREFARSGRRLPCFIQVNTGEEPQKAGCAPQDADAFIADCRDRLKLPVIGLMCIPPAEEEPAPHFALLHKIAKRNGLDQLSMGMSSDFDTAVMLGATHVRVGSAIFGGRSYSAPA
ncbi:MAG: YggS family pyridoxal phosphate-dependent enzyme [Ferrovibrio sp.]|uniref:YggS family pyridoxal phosphate-dependent enzyme n=1 Tax=Ferrovibrio sp. TaxID=1917215 RepID=UPI002634F3E6|nr:YggS family pyridoxal phosphate-dependent enzyme [Ferrovibrio sp.]MCW0232893.1 YggS family pyridoxal phosphate-dependent enzyme [Ferrovibrio sp.]